MNEFPVLDLIENKPTADKVVVPQGLLELKIRGDILHEATRAFQAAQHQGTHSTKTRSEVRGGGHKPWKQKHTGRARAGSIRSPLWRKGGVIFGPKPRDYSLKLTQRKRALALAHALASKIQGHPLFVREEGLLKIQKTRELSNLLKPFNGKGSLLIIVSASHKNLSRAGSNLKHVALIPAASLNAYDLIRAKTCLITEKAWTKLLEERIKNV